MISLEVDTAMTAPVETTTADLSAADAAKAMRDSGIGALVVLDDADEVVGIVTQSDVLGLVASATDVASATVEEICSVPVVTVDADANLLDAAELMKENSVRRLPVFDGDKLVGIVTTTDLTHYMPRLRNTILRDRPDTPKSSKIAE
jgi:CBS domain-containing protein